MVGLKRVGLNNTRGRTSPAAGAAPPRQDRPSEPTLDDKLRFLRQALSDPATGAPPEALETHMSWVFLTRDRALKLKKPVRHDRLDFTTLAAREFDCREELRLNARLAPGIYLGLMALQQDGGGRLALRPEPQGERSQGDMRQGDMPQGNVPRGAVPQRDMPQGNAPQEPEASRPESARHATPSRPLARTVDWLVLMRRLPHERLLPQLIAAGRVETPQIDALARVLTRFFRFAAPAPLTPQDYLARLRHERATDRAVLTGEPVAQGLAPDQGPGRDQRAGGGMHMTPSVASASGLHRLDPAVLPPGAARVLDRLDAALTRHAALLGSRAAGLVEGHGDLRPEHVCLLDPPVVIDCLEFSVALRQTDPIDELAFLAMECGLLAERTPERPACSADPRWLDPRSIGPHLISACTAALGEALPPALMPLYTACRALLRARLILAHLLDPQPRTPGKWPPLARRYVAVAVAALDWLDAVDAVEAMEAVETEEALSPAARTGRP
jgi:aminoglycoside phosphotransferase family enzyme